MRAVLRWRRAGFLTVLLMAGLAGCADKRTTTPTADDSGIEVKLVTYDGLQDAVKQLKGKVVVVDFWEHS